MVKAWLTTISLPDVQYVVGEDFVLLCGGIHPHPGPRSTLKSSVNGIRTQANKCSTTQDSRNRNHYLTVAHLNVRSMASRENFHLIEQIVVNYDIFTISETWLDPSVCDSDLNIPGYILTRQDRGQMLYLFWFSWGEMSSYQVPCDPPWGMLGPKFLHGEDKWHTM